MSSLNELIQTLAGSGAQEAPVDSDQVNSGDAAETSSEYIEKLACAVDFIIESFDSPQGAPEVQPEAEQVSEKTASVEETAQRLKDSLRAKIASKKATSAKKEDAKDQEVARGILGRLIELRDDRASVEEVETESAVDDGFDAVFGAYQKAMKEVESSPEEDSGVDIPDEQAEPTPEVAEEAVAEKAASATNSDLPSVLKAALGSSEPGESVSDDGEAKTAGVCGGEEGPKARKEVTEKLKQQLMAKVGQEKAQ